MRVLHVLDNLGSGGAQSFIMNYIFEMKEKGIVFDFLTRSPIEPLYSSEIASCGGTVYQSPQFPKYFFQNRRYVRAFFREHAREYDVIHVHANSLMYVYPLVLAKKYKIPIRIVHSHSTTSKFIPLRVIHFFNRKRIAHYSTINVACGEEAGKWMFGRNPFQTLYNGIDLQDFKFNENKRIEIRNRLKISPDALVVGHVGALNKAKNHKFLIEVFSKLHARINNSFLVLVGKGNLEASIRERVKEKNLIDYVIFAGQQKNVFEYYNSFDLFAFPSIFEGLPFSLVEAQASGLSCIISDIITTEVDLTDLVTRISLKKSSVFWSDMLYKIYENKLDRAKYSESKKLSLFDNKETIKQLLRVYGVYS